MMNLYIVRHGEAKPERLDPERSLSDSGRADVEKVAARLKNAGVTISTIYHSGKTRASQTAQILAKNLNPDCQVIKKDCLSPDDPVEPLYDEIKDRTQDLMLVGHLPFISVLASRLLCSNDENCGIPFKASTVAILKKDEKGHWHLKDVISPGYSDHA